MTHALGHPTVRSGKDLDQACNTCFCHQNTIYCKCVTHDSVIVYYYYRVFDTENHYFCMIIVWHTHAPVILLLKRASEVSVIKYFGVILRVGSSTSYACPIEYPIKRRIILYFPANLAPFCFWVYSRVSLSLSLVLEDNKQPFRKLRTKTHPQYCSRPTHRTTTINGTYSYCVYSVMTNLDF